MQKVNIAYSLVVCKPLSYYFRNVFSLDNLNGTLFINKGKMASIFEHAVQVHPV